MDQSYLTQERFDELQKELGGLKNKKRVEVAERLKNAKEYGDLSENSEYSEAREEQSLVEGRIFELEEVLREAKIIRKSAVSAENVSVGCTVTVTREGKAVSYTIVGAYDAKPEEGKISDESPLGKAFLGHKAGDSVVVATPSGEASYEIIKIE